MLATLGPLPSPGPAWAYEIKWDGVRAIAYVEGGSVELQGRNMNDITPRYPELATVPESLNGSDTILDGEIVAPDENGRPSFERLQRRMHLADEGAVAARMEDTPVIFVVFDVLWESGRALLEEPYAERRRTLESLGLSGARNWQTGPVRFEDGSDLVELTRQRGFEGVVAKRVDSLYRPGIRSREWIKCKNKLRQEFVIGGWVGGEKGRTGRIGAVLLGYYDGDTFRYAGRAGSGFTSAELDRVQARLEALSRPTSPFADRPVEAGAHWSEPQLVAEVEFTEWTEAGTLRHPVYKGLRDDKAPSDVHRDRL